MRHKWSEGCEKLEENTMIWVEWNVTIIDSNVLSKHVRTAHGIERANKAFWLVIDIATTPSRPVSLVPRQIYHPNANWEIEASLSSLIKKSNRLTKVFTQAGDIAPRMKTLQLPFSRNIRNLNGKSIRTGGPLLIPPTRLPWEIQSRYSSDYSHPIIGTLENNPTNPSLNVGCVITKSLTSS